MALKRRGEIEEFIPVVERFVIHKKRHLLEIEGSIHKEMESATFLENDLESSITNIIGKRPSGKEIVSILKRIVKRLRSAWPEVGILLRGDSYYSCPDVYEFCQEYGVKFVLGFKPYNPLLEKVEALVEEARKRYALERQPVKLFGEFFYQAKSWPEVQRIIVKVEYNALGANVRFIVTNLEHWNRRFIYQRVYCGRGAMELLIKEHKSHLLSDRTSCSRFEANQFRLFLHSVAYVLLHTFRRLHLRGSEFANAQFDTIRLRLLKVGAGCGSLRRK